MKKEILLRVVIDENKIGSILQKTGFEENLSSKLEVIGILHKIIRDEEKKLDAKLTDKINYTTKEPTKKDESW